MNIYELAKKAGVSISTASKALNGRKDVGELTRQKVMKLAERHGYAASRLARGLAKNATENIGLIALRKGGFPFFTNPFYSRVLEGIEAEVAKRDYNLLLSVVDESQAAGPLVPKKIREKNVDGLLLVGYIPPAFLEEIRKRRIPCVLVDQRAPAGMLAHCVLIDNRGGMAEAVRRFAAAGHKRLGYVGGTLDDSSFLERFEGWRAAVKAQGLREAEPLLAPAGAALQPEAMRAWLKAKERPKAVVCANDDHALKLMAVAAELGLRVPEDLALTGFDDIEYAALSSPPLSTLRVDKQALGVRAVRALLAMIEKGAPSAGEERLPVEWVERGTLRA